MLRLNKAIVLAESLVSFILLSTFLVLASNFMQNIYVIKNDISVANNKIIEMKKCILIDCKSSAGNDIKTKCQSMEIKNINKDVCIEF